MEAIPSSFPISLRAWPSNNDKSIALSTLITRINNERGSFRSVTEEDLEEEIKKDEAGLDTGKDDAESENEGSDEDEPDRLKEISTAREQILGELEQVLFIGCFKRQLTKVQASTQCRYGYS
jgi:mediator of RNA polymerase II transcription subunit 17